MYIYIKKTSIKYHTYVIISFELVYILYIHTQQLSNWKLLADTILIKLKKRVLIKKLIDINNINKKQYQKLV